MAVSIQLKKLWRKYREYRTGRKQRRASRSGSGSTGPGKKTSMALDETELIAVGLGLNTKEESEGDTEYAREDDPRFIKNPHGIGCSKTYEVSYEDVMQSLSTPPKPSRPQVPRDIGPMNSNGLPPFANLGAPRSESIDTAKGKRKGRMPDDRYKSSFDNPKSEFQSSGRRFSCMQ